MGLLGLRLRCKEVDIGLESSKNNTEIILCESDIQKEDSSHCCLVTSALGELATNQMHCFREVS